MAAGQGSKIEYIDYNNIQKVINAVLGSGGTNPNTNTADATFGYGQSVSSSTVSQYAKITVGQWNALRNDLLKARQHQTGVDESGSLALPTQNTKITEADRSAYLNYANTIATNRLVTPPSSQVSFGTISTTSRTQVWTSTISQVFTLTFTNADQARYFFNTGGNYKLSLVFGSYTTDGSLLVNQSWEAILQAVGVITFSSNSTTNTGSGTPSTTKGWYQMTTSDTLIYQKIIDASNQYTPNQYDLYARYVSNQLIFTSTFSYTKAGAGNNVFEPVNGTLSITLQQTAASGSNVSVSTPTVSKSGTYFS